MTECEQLADIYFDSWHRYSARTVFVTQLYANVLYRAPNAGGLGFYVDTLDHGVTARAGGLQRVAGEPSLAALIP